MESARKKALALLAAVVLLLGAGVKASRNAVVDLVHSDHRVPPIEAVHLPPPPSFFEYKQVAVGVLCDELTRIEQGDGPPSIGVGDLFRSVAKQTAAELAGGDLFLAEDAIDTFGAAKNISQTINPRTAQFYLRYCPPF